MKTIIVAFLFGLNCIMLVNAQIIQPEKDELITKQELFQQTNPESNLLIQQIGDADKAILATDQEMIFSNKIFISQTGNNHNTTVSQKGSNNEANLYSDGSFTKTNVNQTGDNNSIFSNLSNNTLQLYSAILEQTGNSNSIELTSLGNNVIPDIERVVSVTQTGNKLHFSGTYDSPDVPVKIDQKSGPNGEGMSVNVTTSAFYFPMKQ